MLPRMRWMMQVWTIVAGQTAATESGRPFGDGGGESAKF